MLRPSRAPPPPLLGDVGGCIRAVILRVQGRSLGRFQAWIFRDLCGRLCTRFALAYRVRLALGVAHGVA